MEDEIAQYNELRKSQAKLHLDTKDTDAKIRLLRQEQGKLLGKELNIHQIKKGRKRSVVIEEINECNRKMTKLLDELQHSSE